MFKVLVIDDDQDLRTTVASALSDSHYQVDQAADGEEGVNRVRSSNYDLVLLDVNMPKLDGISFLHKLCDEQGEGEKIPVLITSNLSSMDKISEGVSLGIKGYILKSDESLDTILAGVESILKPKPVEASDTTGSTIIE